MEFYGHRKGCWVVGKDLKTIYSWKLEGANSGVHYEGQGLNREASDPPNRNESI